jgi:hypothetical protein
VFWQGKGPKEPKNEKRSKKGKRRKLTPSSSAKKRKKRDAHALLSLIFLNERSFLLPVFGYFSQSSLSISPSISPAVLLPRGGEERERERESKRKRRGGGFCTYIFLS